MASLLFKEMRGAKAFSCASPASAAICTSIDRRSVVVARSINGGRAIDRNTPHLIGDRRRRSTSSLNLLSQLPSNANTVYQKSGKNMDQRAAPLVSPAGSTRHLLNETAFFDVFPDSEPPALPWAESSRLEPLKRGESASTSPSSTTSTSQEQIVVLRVSLHCKGCEGKVRRHISKMEGVTSFNIELATKKVTVVGNVTPLGVLNSVSKVKSAQFWASATTRSSPVSF